MPWPRLTQLAILHSCRAAQTSGLSCTCCNPAPFLHPPGSSFRGAQRSKKQETRGPLGITQSVRRPGQPCCCQDLLPPHHHQRGPITILSLSLACDGLGTAPAQPLHHPSTPNLQTPWPPCQSPRPQQQSAGSRAASDDPLSRSVYLTCSQGLGAAQVQTLSRAGAGMADTPEKHPAAAGAQSTH